MGQHIKAADVIPNIEFLNVFHSHCFSHHVTGFDLNNTFLRPDTYVQLFNPLSDLRRLSPRPTFTYRHNDAGCIWSLTTIDVDKVEIGSIKRLSELERLRHSFHWTVTHSIDVAVGPLEFCGNAILQKSINGRTK